MKRKTVIILLVLLQLAAAAGCRGESQSKTRVFIDSAGREVEIPEKIERIAVSGQLAQMFVFPLAADSLVGLGGRWSEESEMYISEKYLNLPVFGQFYGTADMNFEEVIAADPQIIIDVGDKKASVAEDMDLITEKTGIPAVFIEANLSDFSSAYIMLGDLLGKEKEAKVLADYCSEVYSRTAGVFEKIGEDKKVTVLYITGERGLNVIASGSFHSQVISMAAVNAAVLDNPAPTGNGNEVSMEQILIWDPDFIIFSPGSAFSSAGNDRVWQQLKAVRNGNYYETPAVPYNWMGFPPSVNTSIGLIWMCETFYPDEFSYDLKEETKKFYKLFYHCELTDEMYEELVRNAVK